MPSFLRPRTPATPPAEPPAQCVWPTVFHVTHHKAGSQWIHKILDHLAHDQIVPPQADQGQVLRDPLLPGRVYPTLYLHRDEFSKLTLPPRSFVFFMLRDMRDVLVSLYYSNKYAHPVEEFPWIGQIRGELERRTVEDGLHWFIAENASGLIDIEHWLRIVRSWLTAGVPVIRYEDLLERDEEILADLFLTRAKLPVTQEHLLKSVRSNRFESLTQGRKRGDENPHAHERKGVAGDWRNHFTPRLKDAFLKRCGSILIETGHERDDAW